MLPTDFISTIPTALQFTSSNLNNAYIPLGRLYSFLELSKSHYSEWVRSTLLKNPRLVEGPDYAVDPQNHDARSRNMGIQRFLITINTAKHLVAMSRSKISHDYRQYLIDSERKYIESLQALIPVRPTHMTIRDYMIDNTCAQMQGFNTTPIGCILKPYCLKRNLEMHSKQSKAGYPILMYPIDVLDIYFEMHPE